MYTPHWAPQMFFFVSVRYQSQVPILVPQSRFKSRFPVPPGVFLLSSDSFFKSLCIFSALSLMHIRHIHTHCNCGRAGVWVVVSGLFEDLEEVARWRVCSRMPPVPLGAVVHLVDLAGC